MPRPGKCHVCVLKVNKLRGGQTDVSAKTEIAGAQGLTDAHVTSSQLGPVDSESPALAALSGVIGTILAIAPPNSTDATRCRLQEALDVLDMFHLAMEQEHDFSPGVSTVFVVDNVSVLSPHKRFSALTSGGMRSTVYISLYATLCARARCFKCNLSDKTYHIIRRRHMSLKFEKRLNVWRKHNNQLALANRLIQSVLFQD